MFIGSLFVRMALAVGAYAISDELVGRGNSGFSLAFFLIFAFLICMQYLAEDKF